jgi:hypothetical protein
VYGFNLNVDIIIGGQQHHLSVLVDVAFSQDQPDKDYVTHHIVCRGTLLSDMLLLRMTVLSLSWGQPRGCRVTHSGHAKTRTH